MKNLWEGVCLIDLVQSLSSPLSVITIIFSHEQASRSKVESRSVLFFSSSCTAGDYLPPFFSDVFLTRLCKQEAFEMMIKKGYQWMEPIDFPDFIWHLHAEGGVVIDVFSETEFLIQPVEKPD